MAVGGQCPEEAVPAVGAPTCFIGMDHAAESDGALELVVLSVRMPAVNVRGQIEDAIDRGKSAFQTQWPGVQIK